MPQDQSETAESGESDTSGACSQGVAAQQTFTADRSVAELTEEILAEESRLRDGQAAHNAEAVPPDGLTPGAGAEPMTLRESLRAGGRVTVLVMFLLAFIDELPRAIRVLAPDIQSSLDISDTALFGILGFGGVTLVLGAVPLAALAARVRRVAVIPLASVFWGAAAFLSGLVVNSFQLFLTSAATGLGQSYRIPVTNSILVDTYPAPARSRIFALEGLGRPVGQVLGPLMIGGIAALVGGDSPWRAAFFAVAAAPLAAAAVSAVMLREPPRGRFDNAAILGDEAHEADGSHEVDELSVSIGVAYARLHTIRTLRCLSVGVAVIGFASIAVPVAFNLLLEDKYALGPFDRGVVEALTWAAALLGLPLAGRLFDSRFRHDPGSVMRLAGLLLAASGVAYAAALPVKTLGLLVALVALAQTLAAMAFVAAPIVIAAVSPFRIRSQAFALLTALIFLVGGFFGGLVLGRVSDAFNERTAMLVLAPPAALIGGGLILRGSRFVHHDIYRSVEELNEERRELSRMTADPGSVPALQVSNLDFAYGGVQVLFDVSLEVAKGEVLALLGPNSAGKTTLLRAISGLEVPSRGIVRLGGRTITYATAEDRFAAGLVHLRGGAGVFESLSVTDNLKVSVLESKLDEAEVEERSDRALILFPWLADRASIKASDLSGGQQQQLALAMALMHDPAVLLIDELSLGLAPVVVQELLEVIERLRAEGQTMVIVEQSINVALALADRVIFLEKGSIHFEGSAQQLAERDDIAQAVLLGGEDR
ncbi:MAG: ATP-binding protein [Acidimicrobiaceae bacterium]|nr:ATP-binding protein [Acidimicrobiaceae bacterium]MCY4279395.1 ATP-binding protein [Acidimicrobiaceae bacterium]